jgi:hypothetical protein
MKIQALLWIPLLLLIQCNMNGQNTALEKDNHYKNFKKYLGEAQSYALRGDNKSVLKFVKNAKIFAKKLIKKGYEQEITTDLQILDQLEEQFSKPSSKSKKSPSSNSGELVKMKPSDFRRAISDLDNIRMQLEALFNINPTSTNLSTYSNPIIKDFNQQQTLADVQQLRNTDAAQQPMNKRHLKTLDKLENLIADLDATFKSKGVYDNINAAFNKVNVNDNQSEFYLKNTEKYINILQQVHPNDNQLKTMKLKIQPLLNAFKEQLAAAKKQEEQARKKSANTVTELPVAGMSDARLEGEFTKLAKPHLPSGLSISKVIITSSSWGVNKDAIGRPIDRMMIAAMIIKGNGKCYVRHFVFKQLARGNTFSSTKVDNSWGSNQLKEIDCSLVK